MYHYQPDDESLLWVAQGVYDSGGIEKFWVKKLHKKNQQNSQRFLSYTNILKYFALKHSSKTIDKIYTFYNLFITEKLKSKL